MPCHQLWKAPPDFSLLQLNHQSPTLSSRPYELTHPNSHSCHRRQNPPLPSLLIFCSPSSLWALPASSLPRESMSLTHTHSRASSLPKLSKNPDLIHSGRVPPPSKPHNSQSKTEINIGINHHPKSNTTRVITQLL